MEGLLVLVMPILTDCIFIQTWHILVTPTNSAQFDDFLKNELIPRIGRAHIEGLLKAGYSRWFSIDEDCFEPAIGFSSDQARFDFMARDSERLLRSPAACALFRNLTSAQEVEYSRATRKILRQWPDFSTAHPDQERDLTERMCSIFGD
jgi:hypothetical protein